MYPPAAPFISPSPEQVHEKAAGGNHTQQEVPGCVVGAQGKTEVGCAAPARASTKQAGVLLWDAAPGISFLMNLSHASVSHCKLPAPPVCSPVRRGTTQTVVFSIFSVLTAGSCPLPLRSHVKMTVSNPYLFYVTSLVAFATAPGEFLHAHVCL